MCEPLLFDEQVGRFLKSFPDGIVVNMGCGLDTRFPRVDNGKVLWFDLDLPEAIAIRRKFLRKRRAIALCLLSP